MVYIPNTVCLLLMFCADKYSSVSAQATTVLPCISGFCPAGLVCDLSTNRCVTSLSATTLVSIATTTATVPVITTTTATCVDKARPGRLSDCPSNANLCNDPLYQALMTDQCPRTCNRCGVTTITLPFSGNFGNGTCVDLALPGRLSECPRHANLCNMPAYRSFMSRQCPRTCNLCTVTNVPVIGKK